MKLKVLYYITRARVRVCVCDTVMCVSVCVHMKTHIYDYYTHQLYSRKY